MRERDTSLSAHGKSHAEFTLLIGVHAADWSKKHTNPRKAVIATLPLFRGHLMNHSPPPARNNNSI
jgi:hypothetical protein